MATLNRFPLLGLWAREAALRLGYEEADADVIGHGYAVLYAIRANSPVRVVKYKDAEAAEAARVAKEEKAEITRITFADDELQVSRNSQGRLIGRVGDAEPQTPQSYKYKIVSKFPAGYHDRLQKAFRDLLAGYSRERLDTRLVYQIYDQWKKGCASGRMVDLDKLLVWCTQRTKKTEEGGKSITSGHLSDTI